MAAVGAAEQQLRSGVTRLFAVAENYPDLKSDASFQRLQSRISALEEALADRRELYNEQVNLNNIRVDVGALFHAKSIPTARKCIHTAAMFGTVAMSGPAGACRRQQTVEADGRTPLFNFRIGPT